MRIGIDGTTLIGTHAGVGRYVYQMCLSLSKLHPNDEFFIYSHSPIKLNLPKGWINRTEPLSFFRHIKGIPWSIFRLPFLMRKDDIDIYWAAGSFAPLFLSKTKLVTTVYDLNYLLVPETMKLFATLMYKFFFKKSLLKSDAILCISKGTRDKLKDLLNINSHEISYPGIDPIFKRVSKDKVKKVLRQYGISSNFILAVGTTEPRKNIITLIQAFNKIQNDPELSKIELVLVGGEGWKNNEYKKVLAKSEGIKTLGYIKKDDLTALYSSTSVFVFPSIYEGFGMPVAEARACSAKVIASDIPELREAGDSSVKYVKPDPETLYESIKDCLSFDQELTQFTNKFSWDSSAKRMSETFHKIYLQ